MIEEVALRVEYQSTSNIYTYVYRGSTRCLTADNTTAVELTHVRISDPIYSQEEQIRRQPAWSPPPGAPRRRHLFR